MRKSGHPRRTTTSNNRAVATDTVWGSIDANAATLVSNLANKSALRRAAYMVCRVKGEVSNLISALSHLGHADETEAKAVFKRASAAFAAEKILMLRSRGEYSLRQIGESLDKLAQSSAAVKKRVLNAATESVTADRVITIAEGELLRVIADSLDCPMSPLLGAKGRPRLFS